MKAYSYSLSLISMHIYSIAAELLVFLSFCLRNVWRQKIFIGCTKALKKTLRTNSVPDDHQRQLMSNTVIKSKILCSKTVYKQRKALLILLALQKFLQILFWKMYYGFKRQFSFGSKNAEPFGRKASRWLCWRHEAHTYWRRDLDQAISRVIIHKSWTKTEETSPKSFIYQGHLDSFL